MARIRTIKPEFWSSEQVMECSTTARLLFIGLWNFCDDAGRHPYAVKQIKALVFPGDDISTLEIDALLKELSKNGLIRIYAVADKHYFEVTGWHHQKIDKAQKPRHPGPNSTTDDDHSPTIPGILGVGKDQGPRTKEGTKDQGPDQGSPNEIGEPGRSVGLSVEFKNELRRAVAPEIPTDSDFSPIEQAMVRGATEADVLEAIRRGLVGRSKPGAWRSWQAIVGWIDGVRQDRCGERRKPEVVHPPPDLGPKVRLKDGKEFSAAYIREAERTGKWFRATMGPKRGEAGCLVPAWVFEEVAA